MAEQSWSWCETILYKSKSLFLESIHKYESQEPGLRTVTMAQLMQDAAYVRNCDVTYGGKTPLEIATGRAPPDIIQIENMNPGSPL